MRSLKTYSELITLPTFEERFAYVKEGLHGFVGEETFGPNRYICQMFYESDFWKHELRPFVIKRDNGCDLGVPGYDISGWVYVHHLVPITVDDILNKTSYAINPEYLISTSFTTHNQLHYGKANSAPVYPIDRTPNDTCPWKR